jgi:EgtB-related family protein
MNPHQAAGLAARRAGPDALALALQASRADTLATFDVMHNALLAAGRRVPQEAIFNPLLWELGHIGWFQTWWTCRNPQRALGHRADPDVPREVIPADAARSDALYDSSRVPHATRWNLPLPGAAQTQSELAEQLVVVLALLGGRTDDASLYFHRLSLLHEDMHHEAALYMAQALGLRIDDARWQPQSLITERRTLTVAGGLLQQGTRADGEFAFDNECGMRTELLASFGIDSRVLNWADYLPAVQAGACPVPRYLRRFEHGWQVQRWGDWQALDLQLPACHVSVDEAQAWCQWAGRRLPTEAEWAFGAEQLPEAFAWGAVWEWTATAFAPYPGFEPHPYRDYSAPWFDSRPVLRGASFVTQPRMHHLRYRNFFSGARTDIFAGFRSCPA